MKALYTAILFLTFGFSGICQNVDLNFNTIENSLNLGGYHYALADKINVRDCSSLNCEKVGTLKIGQRIVLEKRSENMNTINTVISNWYKIRAEGINGWVFGSFISQQAFGSLSDLSVKFVFGLKSVDHSEGWRKKTYQIRAIKDNQEIDNIEFPIFTSYINFIKTIGHAGLNLKDVIVIDIPCEGGCGCSTGELVVFWNGEKFSKVEDLLGLGDAWASESIKFIYPTDMEGIENVIIKVSDSFDEELSDNKIRRRITKEYFKWNKTELIPDPSRESETRTYTKNK